MVLRMKTRTELRQELKSAQALGDATAIELATKALAEHQERADRVQREMDPRLQQLRSEVLMRKPGRRLGRV
jgi:hypothetical protein